VRILGREPAVFFSMAATVVMAGLLLFPISEEVHGYVNAVVLALAGLLTAAFVSVDAAVPALTGLLKAVFALVLALGMDVPEATQVGILTLVTAVAAFFVRSQVVAKVAPQPAAQLN
jgi:hypothetical protein